jgi:SAM-dependent methyltransferase
MYHFGITPWERYGTAAARSIATLLDREEKERSRPLGRALDLGCGRGQYTPEVARRGWQAVGIDNVPAAIEAAKRKGTSGATYVVGDVTDLPEADLGTFDFFLDVGCFQGLNAEQRDAEGHGVTTLANPEATLLMPAFGRTWMRSLVEGVSQGRGRNRIPGLGDARSRARGYPGAGLADEQDTTSVVPQWYRLRGRTWKEAPDSQQWLLEQAHHRCVIPPR